MSGNTTTWVAVERCHLCERTRKNFSCCKCIKTGNFTRSNNKTNNSNNDNSNSDNVNDGDSFAEKRALYDLVKGRSEEYSVRIAEVLREDDAYYVKKNRILLLRSRVDALKQVLRERREVNRDEKNENQDLLRKLFGRKDAYRSLESKRAKLLEERELLRRRMLEEGDQKARLSRRRHQLKKWQVYQCHGLVKYIFPISERKLYPEFGTTSVAASPSYETGQDDIVSEVTSAAELELEDATRHVHVDGHWMPEDFRDTEYAIVSVGMPALCDFIKYYEWLKSYRNEPKKHESKSGLHGNCVLNIPASLVYTTQLTAGLSSILGTNLPHHVEYYDFSIFKVSRRRLFNLVHKLSQNVMHLCFSQCLHLDTLNPHQMLRNLRLLTSQDNSTQLGWVGSYDTHVYTMNETFIGTESSGDEDEDDEESYSENLVSIDTEEWDRLLDMPSDPSEIQSDVTAMSTISSPRDQSLSSSATDLVSSAAASVMSYWSWKK